MPVIQAVDRALKILDLFDEENTELKLTEISEKLSLHKSTVHALLRTLRKHRYIDQNPETGKYRLGMKLFERGSFVVQSLDIRVIGRECLFELSDRSGHTVHLVVLDGKEGVYIDKVEGKSGTTLYSRIGRRVPIHTSAVGKALVAFKNKEEISELLKDYVFQAHTTNTITSKEQFLKELDVVRRLGYATDKEENEQGVYCVAVPIRDHTGHVVYAMSMSVLAANISEDGLDHIVDMLKESARKLSRQLGYSVSAVI